MLVVDGVRYKPWTPKDEEKEFHPLVKANSKEIFGKDSIYFDVKTMIKTASGIGSIPDAYVIDLAEPYQWYVVENELSTHPYEHFVKQLTKFINGLDNQNSRTQILDLLYREIDKDSTLRTTILSKTKFRDIHHFLSKLISIPPKIVVIIDEKTPEVEEACQALKYTPKIVEFRSFTDETDSYAHLFEPINETEPYTQEKIIKPISFDENYQQSNKQVKDLYANFFGRMLDNFEDRKHKTSGSYLVFCRGEIGSKTRFAALMLHEDAITIRIRTNPTTLNDPQKLLGTKTNKLFFHQGNGQEREIKITNDSQIPYAIELIKQSYELAK